MAANSSVLHVLKNSKLANLRGKLNKIPVKKQVTLQWVSSYCGVPGNKE